MDEAAGESILSSALGFILSSFCSPALDLGIFLACLGQEKKKKRTALLRYNSYAVRFTHLRGSSVVVSVAQIRVQSPQSILGPYHHLRKKPHILDNHHCPLSRSPEQPLMYFCVCSVPCYEPSCERNPTLCVAFHDWPLSLSAMFSRLIHIVVCASISFLLVAE